MSVNNLPGARAAFPTPALDLAMMFLVTAFYHIGFGRYNRIWFYGIKSLNVFILIYVFFHCLFGGFYGKKSLRSLFLYYTERFLTSSLFILCMYVRVCVCVCVCVCFLTSSVFSYIVSLSFMHVRMYVCVCVCVCVCFLTSSLFLLCI